MSTWEIVVTIVGLGLITLVTRSFFLIPTHEVRLPGWLKQGLRYAPLVALVAVVVPEVFMTQGQLIDTWRDARLPAAAVATAYWYWRRDILGTILCGSAVMLAFRLGLGW